jgi:hypothetical protein
LLATATATAAGALRRLGESEHGGDDEGHEYDERIRGTSRYPDPHPQMDPRRAVHFS